MPSDETRRVLKTLGIAVTEYEDAVHNGAASDVVRRWEVQVHDRLEEVRALVERLRNSGASGHQP